MQIKDLPNLPAGYRIDVRGNLIHGTAIIGSNVDYGYNNHFGPYCIIGEIAEHAAFLDKPVGRVVIGDNNYFFGACTIDAGTVSETIIGSRCLFLKRAHVGHDSIIHDDVTVSVGAIIGGHAVVFNGANIGLNATIHQKHVIGHYSMVGMNACVPLKREVQPFGVYAGNPVALIGPNKHAIDKLGEEKYREVYEKSINEYSNQKHGINITAHH